MRTVRVLVLLVAACLLVAGCTRGPVETITEGGEAYPEGGELSVAVACGGGDAPGGRQHRSDGRQAA